MISKNEMYMSFGKLSSSADKYRKFVFAIKIKFSLIRNKEQHDTVYCNVDKNMYVLAHLSRQALKGELIVYPCSGVRRRRYRRCLLTIFKHILL